MEGEAGSGNVHGQMLADGSQLYFEELLRRRLMECGWCDQMRMICKEVINEKGKKISVDELLAEVSLRARTLVPMSVKKELLQKVKNHLLNQAGYYNRTSNKTQDVD
ncbi:transcription and mRNA export factor ENY2-like [Nilaparvata lugens]|uniref:transcription and mRNA export factor ENY2-like n=1 Tax=Nilaparvata lugens TaxID=108931 RepID=UPI00193DF6C7|nr:transcription and mRNA export factor ENY2-like [Nilaparvata lugens]